MSLTRLVGLIRRSGRIAEPAPAIPDGASPAWSG